MSSPLSANASRPPSDNNKKVTETCSWNAPELNLFFKHRILLRDTHFEGQKVVATGMESVWKSMFDEDPTLVNKSKITMAKMMSKWFAMRKVVQAYNDSQQRTGAAYEEPPPYYAEMNECFSQSQKNVVRGCQYGIQSTTSGPIKRFGFGYVEESTSPGESAKKSDGSTVRTSISTRIQFRVFFSQGIQNM